MWDSWTTMTVRQPTGWQHGAPTTTWPNKTSEAHRGRKTRGCSLNPVYINRTEIDHVSSCKFLLIHTSKNLSCIFNTSTLNMKARQHLFFMSILRKSTCLKRSWWTSADAPLRKMEKYWGSYPLLCRNLTVCENVQVALKRALHTNAR